MSFFNLKIERGKFEAANLNAGKSIGPRVDTSLAIGSMVVWDVRGGFFGAVGGDEVPDNRGLERWQRRCGPPADEGMALAKTSIAMTKIIGRVVVGYILNDCILNLACATAGG